MKKRGILIKLLMQWFPGHSLDYYETVANQIISMSRYSMRSDKENRYYWAVIVKTLADFCGYTSEEMHEALKWQFLKVVTPGKPNKVRSTSDLTTVEAEEYYESIRQWAAQEYGVIIPLPNEVL